MKPWRILAVALAATLVIGGQVGQVAAQESGVAVGGEVPQPYRLTPELFKTLGPVEVIAPEHGGDPHRYRGIPLRAVFERAGVKFGDALRGPLLAAYILVEAADGYRVVFPLASLDETFGGIQVYLVDAMDDQALGAEQGPYRVVVPGDGRPARWARQVIRLSVQSPP